MKFLGVPWGLELAWGSVALRVSSGNSDWGLGVLAAVLSSFPVEVKVLASGAEFMVLLYLSELKFLFLCVCLEKSSSSSPGLRILA